MRRTVSISIKRILRRGWTEDSSWEPSQWNKGMLRKGKSNRKHDERETEAAEV
jgi:hypothetical protein